MFISVLFSFGCITANTSFPALLGVIKAFRKRLSTDTTDHQNLRLDIFIALDSSHYWEICAKHFCSILFYFFFKFSVVVAI